MHINQISLSQLRQFIVVAQRGSFSRAADELAMSAPAVTNAIKKLETELGARLLERTTRTVRLTEAGEDFYQHCLQATLQLQTGLDNLQLCQNTLGGNIRISAPADLARTLLSQWLQEFVQTHPNIRFDLTVTDTVTNLYQAPVDLAIRYTTPQDSGLIARELFPARRVACASPAYIEQFGSPKTPDELTQHRCLTYKVSNQPDCHWSFSQNGQEHGVSIQPFAVFDDSSLARQWAIDGLGIVYKSELDVRNDIQSGLLRPILGDFTGQASPLFLVHPSRLHTRRLTTLAEFLQARFSTLK
ncbi:LysR family transcriptional regulator [Gilvimarinus sp. SDUM040013]|uniref:LysR family transcriptional regulator n=1 Tax=Gilvimarinus gilvus TaxID=3058038 RepID=A0ABU4S1E8_9GAMM|nr:LysR family transcriptional regulator [Gilvimarinus sp. SDUM040013]MDO3388072.1 LysR family transcriptional regulator [Gilvimarinus sp. SDUM040013]MDX6850980.1 LysR family transcriptional regulator [Gilvimarinus sp. SDUM040013]